MPSRAYTACVRAVAVLFAACLCSATTVTSAPTAADALAALGLHVRSVDGQFEVTKANSSSIHPGELLVAADRDSISAQSFAQALQTRTSPFVLPVVNYAAGSGEDIDGYPLAGFIRVEFFTPDALMFQAPDGAKHDVVLRSTPKPAPRAVAEAEVDAAAEPTFDDDDSELGAAYVATFARAGPLGLELATTPAGRVVVKGVVPNAAAAKAGVVKDDVLVSINGQVIARGATISQAIDLLAKASHPKRVELRMGDTHQKELEAKERAAQEAAQREADAKAAAAAAALEAARAAAAKAARAGSQAKPGSPPPEPTAKPATPPPKTRAERLAAVNAAAAAKALEIPDNEYEAVYTGGSMGLEFDAAAEGLVISGVVRSGASDKAGVKPGDRVVKVNGEDVEELDFRGAVAKIVAAEWPKTLQFRRAEVVVQDDPEMVGGGLVELSKPDMVAGVRVKVKAALFGHALTSCTRTVHFTLAHPLMGCGDQPLLSNLTRDERAEQDPSGDELYFVNLRGGCTFPEKALKATLGNADGMVVVSNSAPVVRMPGDAALKTNVAAAMAAQHDGMMLAGAAMVGPVEGRFLMDDVEGCQFDGTEVLPVLPKPDNGMEADNGGRLLVWNGTDETSFGYVLAMFGPDTDPGIIAPLVQAQPFSGCLEEGRSFTNVNDLAHSFAVVQRGVCAFSDKVRNLQKLKVKGVIVVNTDDRLMPMPASPPHDDIVTPAVMIAPGFLEHAIGKAQPDPRTRKLGEPPSLLGRLVSHAISREGG